DRASYRRAVRPRGIDRCHQAGPDPAAGTKAIQSLLDKDRNGRGSRIRTYHKPLADQYLFLTERVQPEAPGAQRWGAFLTVDRCDRRRVSGF
ncbi:hypothetical protein RA307_02455, partial [Xanthobacteraceae bacterium Astr-EGSB]|uniref:hypothetical protein n=1 Tax=Astrobacterium formosum TaxID=3069710 RepID=UPI0027AFAC08|nr:hypothetical protein [Xanthobacteraceae bacterium Astr-EGSB]